MEWDFSDTLEVVECAIVQENEIIRSDMKEY